MNRYAIAQRVRRVAPFAAAGLGLFSLSSSAYAALLSEPTNILSSTSNVITDFCNIMNWLFWGLIVFSIIMFLVGGYRYATSGGEAEMVSKANKTLLYAAIGVVVALLAAGAPYVIANLFNVTVGNACSGGSTTTTTPPFV